MNGSRGHQLTPRSSTLPESLRARQNLSALPDQSLPFIDEDTELREGKGLVQVLQGAYSGATIRTQASNFSPHCLGDVGQVCVCEAQGLPPSLP